MVECDLCIRELGLRIVDDIIYRDDELLCYCILGLVLFCRRIILDCLLGYVG